jgi:hypothetical protein
MMLSNEIKGTPIKIENLEIAQFDFNEVLDWSEAKQIFDDLEEGWRFPTKEELNTLFNNKDLIGAFADSFYWSSTEGNYGFWRQHFNDGRQFDTSKKVKCNVRAVRASI